MTDADVRRAIYDLTIRNGSTPAIGGVAAELGASDDDVRDAFHRLAAQRIIVLDGRASVPPVAEQPGRLPSEILMAAPFSGVPTPFVVHIEGTSYYANCIWDALGVSPMLKKDSTLETSCPDCMQPIELQVRGTEVVGEGIVHFSIPAREWWNDIVYT